MDNANLSRMWRVFKTTKEMCADRGYSVPEHELNITFDEFKQEYGRDDGDVDRTKMNYSCQPSESMLLKYSDPPTEKNPNPEPQIGTIWVEFNGDDNAGLKHLRDYMHFLNQGNFYSGIMITPKQMTGMALRFLRTSTTIDEGPKGGVEVFVEQDLLVNITKHELVPKHVLLSAEEKKQLLSRYRLRETQLPRIQQSDPVAKYLGLRRGQVVKIIRKSETAGRYASYRWCI
ncbi:RPB5 subunit of DNA-directed RNA polymerase [Delitschia confertaspora ATCC 74209]|uniref:DNA-directed RNA polymerases I, II, and III subunit RPABC1 n=1 Tax=Delitschia confertaspora ATCC 74209 TaxID=1513339 RepID=A0A9P4JB71_9PLEO|nr:RPB5 subunit of DNA-directed RNA polymerase [Delitschia confertaspora ATCC 74209]